MSIIMKWFGAVRAVRFTGQDWSSGLVIAIISGFGVVFYYGWTTGMPEYLASSLLLSGAFLVLGMFMGFLFGIPRSLQSEGLPPPPDKNQSPEMRQEAQRLRTQYRANTNLEQISDWLTKILVGVGLTQLGSLPDYFSEAGNYFGVALGSPDSETAARIAIGMIIFFSTCGFLLGYLWTRLFLGGELARADREAVSEEQVREIAEEQAQVDANAISMVTRYLSEPSTKISVDELKAAVEKASAPVKVQVFYKARETRSESWQKNEDKPRLERTIPVFEALAESDTERRFHQNHGQLGYALKDKRNPDYAKAETELTTAIEIRGPANKEGWEIYEFNRAICRIKQDVSFREGRQSSPETRDKILADLKIAIQAFPDLFGDSDIRDWLERNKVNDIVMTGDKHETTS